MPKVSVVDYKRVSGLFRKTITVSVPEELVARKGRTAVGRRRCRQAEQRLTEAIHAELAKIGRRAFRSDVAIHLELRGASLDHPSEATRTVKAILDSMKGPVYPDDRAVALLDVSLRPGPLQAEIAFCSARQYADAFDVLSGVSRSRDDRWCDADDPWHDIVSRDDPWAWNRESPFDEYDLEITEENLAHLKAGNSLLSVDLRAEMIEVDHRQIREHKRASLLSMPYLPTDRPGPPSLAGRLWNDVRHFPSPARIYLPAPTREGQGSWTAIAREAFASHFGHWREVTPLLQDEPAALDIAIGTKAADSFDVDNLAARVLRALRESVPGLPGPPAYRVYRRHGDDDAVVVTLHAVRRAANLRLFLAGSPLATCGLQPDADGPVYRCRPIDNQLYEAVQKLDLAAG